MRLTEAQDQTARNQMPKHSRRFSFVINAIRWFLLSSGTLNSENNLEVILSDQQTPQPSAQAYNGQLSLPIKDENWKDEGKEIDFLSPSHMDVKPD